MSFESPAYYIRFGLCDSRALGSASAGSPFSSRTPLPPLRRTYRARREPYTCIRLRQLRHLITRRFISSNTIIWHRFLLYTLEIFFNLFALRNKRAYSLIWVVFFFFEVPDPVPLCVPFPSFPFVSGCIRFTRIRTDKGNIRACMKLELSVTGTEAILWDMQFSCFRIGADGIIFNRPPKKTPNKKPVKHKECASSTPKDKE